jgi:Domain of unknown function (DUF6268)
MKSILGMVLAWIVCAAGPVAQGADSAFEPKAAGSSSGATSMSMELDADYGFVAGSKTHTGGHNLGEVTEQNSSFKFVASPEITKDLLFRAGVEWERFSFGLPNAAPLPNTLQRVDAVLGMDYQIDENWLMRLDVSPGVYSDFADVSMDDVNAPFVLGASYLADADLQWFVGLRVDVRSRYWLVPVGGIRWKYADEWTARLFLPNPRLEYELNKKVLLFLGASVEGGTYRLADNFGTSHGIDPRTNGAMLDFLEVRAGPGVSWKALPNLTVEAEVGSMLYREFEFSNPHMYVRSNSPAPYAQISCHMGF